MQLIKVKARTNKANVCFISGDPYGYRSRFSWVKAKCPSQ